MENIRGESGVDNSRLRSDYLNPYSDPIPLHIHTSSNI